MQNRRKFLQKSALGIAGLAVAPAWLQGAPSLIKSFNKPTSEINGVKIGCITYSFRSMPDQSAEATLKYVVDSGLSSIELMGDPAESFAGMPASPINRSRMFQLGGKQRRGEALTEDETKELADMQAQAQDYNKTIAAWRANADMKKFEQMRKMYKDAGVTIYAFKPNAFGQNNTDSDIAYGMNAAKH